MTQSNKVTPGANPSRTRDLFESYWSTLTSKGATAREAITLEKNNSSSPSDFHVYGLRLAQRMIKSFEAFGDTDPAWAKVAEIGCGIGRFVLPMACRFGHVHAIDISPEIIAEAKRYCSSVPNVTYHVNDGETLAVLPDDCIQYAYSAGVFQHIIYFETIAGYIKEAFRVLQPRGIFLFSFQIWQSGAVGKNRVGAKITAKALETAMSALNYEILEIVVDPKDPVPHMAIVVRKLPDGAAGSSERRSFSTFPVTHRDVRTGVFEDLESSSEMREMWKKPQRPITFYEDA